jgi:hypothetical protein
MSLLRIIRKHWVAIWVATVVLYSVVRSLLAQEFLSQYGVQAMLFFAIDVGTAFPYAYGLAQVALMFKRKNMQKVWFWLVITIVFFLAPYLYLFLAGQNMPASMYIGIAAFMALAIFLGTRQILRTLSHK